MFHVDRPNIPLNAVKWEMIEGEIVRTKCGKIFPLPEQDVIGEAACAQLNRSIPHTGSWRVVWCQPIETKYDRESHLYKRWVPTVLEFQWLDKDGDPIFKVDTEDEPSVILDIGLSHYLDQCEEAYQKVYEFRHKIVNIDPEQTFKQSQGQAPVSGRYEQPADIA